MINFYLGVFWNGMEILTDQIRLARLRGDEEVNAAGNRDIHKFVQVVTQQCVGPLRLLTAATGACVRLEDMFFHHPYKKYTYNQIGEELQRLYDEIKRDAIRENFFHYPREMVSLIQSINNNWQKTVAAFPMLRKGIERGLDCYALGDYSGCVFHMMGIAEAGLRAIAKERGIRNIGKKPLEWAMWQNVFQAIEGELRIIRAKTPGPRKDMALAFYDTAISDLRRLQSYRDQALHFRADYDKGEAYDAIFRAKSLMETLAAKLGETKSRKIRWGL